MPSGKWAVRAGTVNAQGGVGLWTKANSQTCFDNLEVSVPA
jgi:hypothetical protein